MTDAERLAVADQIAQVAGIPPFRGDWDFRSRFKVVGAAKASPFDFLGDAEVMTCHSYEFAREDERWTKEALAWRAPAVQQTFSGFLKLWRAARGQRPNTEFYVLWPEWPVLPYLKIPSPVRRARLELWTGREFKLGSQGNSKAKRYDWAKPPLQLVSMSHLFANRDVMWEKPDWIKGAYKDAKVGDVISFTSEDWATREFAAFDIDWRQPDAVIIERFGEWVRRRRRENRIREKATQGSASVVSSMRAALVALGAWRLKEKFGLKFDDAHSLTTTESGKALYENPESATRAVKRLADAGELWWVLRNNLP